MTAYSALARHYDKLNASVDTEKWADYLVRHFGYAGIPVRTVVDLACGTGSLAVSLSGRGYEVIGADASGEMLSVAAQKAQGMANAPVFICQDMTRLDLYGTVDAAVCCLDSVNYLTKPKDLQKMFRRVSLFLNPGGVFVFDIHTRLKLERLGDRCFTDETEDVFCAWRSFYSEKRRLATFVIDLFERREDVWLRSTEEHFERAYEPEEIAGLLRSAGFGKIKCFGNLKMRAPGPDEERIFFRCVKAD